MKVPILHFRELAQVGTELDVVQAFEHLGLYLGVAGAHFGDIAEMTS